MHDIDDDVEPQMDNRRDLAMETWCVVVESLSLWSHCFALNGGWKSESEHMEVEDQNRKVKVEKTISKIYKSKYGQHQRK